MNAPNHAISGSRLVARALMASVERPVVAGIPVCRPRLLSGLKSTANGKFRLEQDVPGVSGWVFS
jgi:hypothetical protein